MSRCRRSSGPLCSAFSTTPSLFNRWRRRKSSGCIALGFIRKLIFSLFHFLGLFDFLETDVSWSETQTQVSEYPPVSAVLIREILLVMKFGEAVCDGDAPYLSGPLDGSQSEVVLDEMQDEFNQRLWAASGIT
ncbi:uncharacterized protein LOC117914488 [Vitis riparia]|uniref:uncharacterized protein LOC117914488 n=1 Tax=Vitis riparia TaxID=96939 RepID=UPI00155A9EBC|nr:uncharacterized protein LOC117914488 [Vitis riparia]